MKKRIDVKQGDKYGRWTVVREEKPINGDRAIRVKCVCGNEKIVRLKSLVNGQSTSCGCYRKEYISQRNYKHGFTNRNSKIERLYNIWIGMKRRCYDTKDKGYHNYGGRGITICDEWLKDYSSFRRWAYNNGYSENLTIDRIDNDKGYSPENCRWTTMEIQSNNTRFNHHVTYKGETHTLAEWGRITGIKDDYIGRRLKKGFPLEKVFFYGNLRKYKEREDVT